MLADFVKDGDCLFFVDEQVVLNLNHIRLERGYVPWEKNLRM